MKKLTNNISLNNISIFLLLIYPAGLVVGPFVAEILMNLINIFFLYQVFKEKNFRFLKEKFFLIFIVFYLYIFLNIFLSDYSEKIIVKHIFYFRHIIFVFAVVNLLLKNQNLIFLFYKALIITILVVSIDGIIQFLFGSNSLGYISIRSDRLTGFFEDKMILGSYIARLLPLCLGLFIYNYKLLNKKNLLISIFILVISFITIILSGERMAFLTSLMFVLGAFILLNYSKKIKLLLVVLTISTVSILLVISPTLMNRHIQQTVDQINFKFDSANFFSNFVFYKDTYKTAFNGYLDNKIFGLGARSFRFFCSDPRYESVTSNTGIKSLDSNPSSKNKVIYIKTINFKNNDFIKKGDVILTYIVQQDKQSPDNHDLVGVDLNYKKIKNHSYHNFEGYISSNASQHLNKYVPAKDIFFVLSSKRNGCTSHPHNFYLQLLSETGILGFIFILTLFSYFIFLICKNFILQIFNKKKFLTNFQICLLLHFVITLLPMIPNGNFFNNWLSMIMFLPVGFYIFSARKIYQ
jgi:O-antigen ligase